MFRRLHNTARVFRNEVAKEVEAIERAKGDGIKFKDVAPLVAGNRYAPRPPMSAGLLREYWLALRTHKKQKQIHAGLKFQPTFFFLGGGLLLERVRCRASLQSRPRRHTRGAFFGDAFLFSKRGFFKGSRGREAEAKGDADGGIWTAGQVVGLIGDLPTCAELVARMVAEAEGNIRGRLAGMLAEEVTFPGSLRARL